MLSPTPPRSPRRLHSFALPPSWGRQKLLRCVKPPPLPIPPNPELRSLLLSHYDVHDKPPEIPTSTNNHVTIPAADDDPGAPRPWNLRKRRAAAFGVPRTEESPSPEKGEKDGEPRRRNRGAFMQLTSEEIEEDLVRMCICIGRRKPRRRGQRLQRVIDNLSPGECLCRMVEEWYRILEERKKR